MNYIFKKKRYDIIAIILHWTLIGLCLYSIGCCGFHILPSLGVSDSYESINMTLLSVALSYIAGYVIYLLTSVLPRRQRSNEVFTHWKPYLSDLYNEMSSRIEEIRAYAGITAKSDICLTEKDCEALKRYTEFPLEVLIAKTIIKEDQNDPLRIDDYFNIKKDLNRHHDTVIKLIDAMLNNPMAIYADMEVLDILSQIRSSHFIEECNRIMEFEEPIISNGIKFDIITEDIPKAYVDYVKLRDKLGKFPITKHQFEMRIRTSEEISASQKAINDSLAERGLNIESVQKIGQRLTNASKR